MSIRVLVADDHSMVRAGFRMLLTGEQDIEVVAEASNGLEAVDKTRRLNPAVVLMDIRMPEMDGIEATRRILAANSAARTARIVPPVEQPSSTNSTRPASGTAPIQRTAPVPRSNPIIASGNASSPAPIEAGTSPPREMPTTMSGRHSAARSSSAAIIRSVWS